MSYLWSLGVPYMVSMYLWQARKGWEEGRHDPLCSLVEFPEAGGPWERIDPCHSTTGN